MVRSQYLVCKRYQMLDTIGEGTCGKVKMGTDKSTGRRVAIKMMPVSGKRRQDDIQREVFIMNKLDHPNIIRLLDVDCNDEYYFLVLELAELGELFDKIGIHEDYAHLYFRQLLAGVECMHRNDVAHRDLKPENLLLDRYGNLKITDFNMSTLIRYKGVSRKLKTPCGTRPYAAPEVLRGDYDGDAADIWSCGVILYVMLCGRIPWDEPTDKCWEFERVRNRKFDYDPFTTFSPEVLDLLSRILHVDPKKRATIAQIKDHAWYNRRNSILEPHSGNSRKRDIEEVTNEFAGGITMSSQLPQHKTIEVKKRAVATQPILNISSQVNSTPSQNDLDPDRMAQSQLQYGGGPQTQFRRLKVHQELVRKRSKFCTMCDLQMLIQRLTDSLTDNNVNIADIKDEYKFSCTVESKMHTVENGVNPVMNSFKVIIKEFESDSSVLVVEFRRCHGDVLEFNSLYKQVYNDMKDILHVPVDEGRASQTLHDALM